MMGLTVRLMYRSAVITPLHARVHTYLLPARTLCTVAPLHSTYPHRRYAPSPSPVTAPAPASPREPHPANDDAENEGHRARAVVVSRRRPSPNDGGPVVWRERGPAHACSTAHLVLLFPCPAVNARADGGQRHPIQHILFFFFPFLMTRRGWRADGLRQRGTISGRASW
jgi:hypothetical protein